MNEEKVTVAGRSMGSKEFLRRKIDKNVAKKQHGNMLRIHNNNTRKSEKANILPWHMELHQSKSFTCSCSLQEFSKELLAWQAF